MSTAPLALADLEGRGRLVTRPFAAITVATFAYFCAVGINLPVLPQYVKEGLGSTGLAVGVVLGCYSVAAIAVRPLLSWIGVRRGPRLAMRIGPVVAVVGYALCATNEWLAALVVLRMVVGVAEALHFVGGATMINELAPPDRRAEAASYYSVAVFGGLGVGPLIGEAMATRGLYHEAFLAAAGCALLAWVLGFAVPRTVGRPIGVDADAPPRLIHPKAATTGAVLALGIVGYTAWGAFITLQAEDVGMSNAGLVFVVYSVLVLALRVVGARVPERVGLAKCAASALVLDAAGLGLIAIWNSVAGVFAGTVLLGLGTSLLYPALQTIAVNSVPDDERPSVVSTFTMFFEVGGAVGALALGAVADIAGYRGAFAAGAVVALLGLPVLWHLVVVPRRRGGPRVAGHSRRAGGRMRQPSRREPMRVERRAGMATSAPRIGAGRWPERIAGTGRAMPEPLESLVVPFSGRRTGRGPASP